MYYIKRNWLRSNCSRQTSKDYYQVVYAMQSFLALDFFKYRAKEKSNIYFLRDFQIMVKNDQQ